MLVCGYRKKDQLRAQPYRLTSVRAEQPPSSVGLSVLTVLLRRCGKISGQELGTFILDAPGPQRASLATYRLFHRVTGERAHVSLETTQAENPAGAGIFPL